MVVDLRMKMKLSMLSTVPTITIQRVQFSHENWVTIVRSRKTHFSLDESWVNRYIQRQADTPFLPPSQTSTNYGAIHSAQQPRATLQRSFQQICTLSKRIALNYPSLVKTCISGKRWFILQAYISKRFYLHVAHVPMYHYSYSHPFWTRYLQLKYLISLLVH